MNIDFLAPYRNGNDKIQEGHGSKIRELGLKP